MTKALLNTGGDNLRKKYFGNSLVLFSKGVYIHPKQSLVCTL